MGLKAAQLGSSRLSQPDFEMVTGDFVCFNFFPPKCGYRKRRNKASESEIEGCVCVTIPVLRTIALSSRASREIQQLLFQIEDRTVNK